MTRPSPISEEDFRLGCDLLFSWSRNIAMLPLEEWRDALNHGETVCAFLDPTLFREYLYSKKPEILKEVLDAAIALKAVVMKHQETVREMREGEVRR